MDNNKIGKFIASLRKEKGLTQQELGDKLFVTDKAVRKWERGLSLPDISLLKKLAKELGVEVTDILDGKKGTTRKIDIEKELEKLTSKLKKMQRSRYKKIILIVIILIFIIIYIMFRNLFFGYNVKKVNYSHTNRIINLGIPKTSFLMKNNDRSYSFKNFRNSNIIENEIKKYLKTLKYSICNNTIYYYDEKDDFSIINYSVKNHTLYSTISYEIVENDYCFTNKMNEYSKKLGGIKRIHTLNDFKISLSEDKQFTPRLVLDFFDDIDIINQKFTAKLEVKYLSPIPNRWNIISREEIEKSVGTYEIKDDKLYYYRMDILEKSDNINIPEVSVFKIENESLILIDNYLSNYEDKIILK